MVASLISFVGFGLGITMATHGILESVRERLQMAVVGPEEGATLAGLLGVNPWLLITVLAVLGGFWLVRVRPSSYQGGWRWPVTGCAVGLIGVAAWLLSGYTGRQYGLSVTEPTYLYMRFFLFGDSGAVNWASFMLLGIPLGAYLAARAHGEFKWRTPAATRLLQALGGGVVMGVGAAIGGGCTVGHSLTGVSILSPASLVASGGIILGVWSATWVLFRP